MADELIDRDDARQVRELVTDLRDRPDELPLRQVVTLASTGEVDVALDLTDDPPLVFVEARPSPVFDPLSTREREVAQLIAGGCTNRQIADALFIAEATVKDHVHAVYRKTGLRGRAAVAAAWARRR